MSQSIEILVADDDAEFSRVAAQRFIKILEVRDHPLVTLPTGYTPLGFYQALITDYGQRRDLWDGLRFIALDEYCGLSADDERLFASWLARTLLDPLAIKSRLLFDSAADPQQEMVRVRSLLHEQGPLDVAVLGLGGNGHVAFNEPGTPFTATIHTVTLTTGTIAANALYWGGSERVPPQGITLGIQDLAQAGSTILLVKGAAKAEVLQQTLQGPVTAAIPASYLQTIKNVTIIADRDAATRL